MRISIVSSDLSHDRELSSLECSVLSAFGKISDGASTGTAEDEAAPSDSFGSSPIPRAYFLQRSDDHACPLCTSASARLPFCRRLRRNLPGGAEDSSGAAAGDASDGLTLGCTAVSALPVVSPGRRDQIDDEFRAAPVGIFRRVVCRSPRSRRDASAVANTAAPRELRRA